MDTIRFVLVLYPISASVLARPKIIMHSVTRPYNQTFSFILKIVRRLLLCFIRGSISEYFLKISNEKKSVLAFGSHSLGSFEFWVDFI